MPLTPSVQHTRLCCGRNNRLPPPPPPTAKDHSNWGKGLPTQARKKTEWKTREKKSRKNGQPLELAEGLTTTREHPRIGTSFVRVWRTRRVCGECETTYIINEQVACYFILRKFIKTSWKLKKLAVAYTHTYINTQGRTGKATSMITSIKARSVRNSLALRCFLFDATLDDEKGRNAQKWLEVEKGKELFVSRGLVAAW